MNEKTSILVIDDNQINLLVMRQILTHEGFDIIESISGTEGRKLAREHQPDLILLDIEMPGENGFETCNLLKKDQSTAHIPVIFITALSDVSSKVLGLGLDAVDYVTKPFEPEEVLARTKLHIRLSRAQKALIEMQKEKLRQISSAQESILVKPEDFPMLTFSVVYKPIMEAGGDFYDVIDFGNNIFGFFCADVSGHDVGSTLATSAFKALIHQNAGPLYPPAETMQIINNVLISSISEGKYLSALYVLFNRNRHKLKIVSAGHPPLIYMEKEGEVFIVEQTGDLLGLFDSVSFSTIEKEVHKGDRFFLFTDGLIEGFTNRRLTRREGIKNLIAVLIKYREENLKSLIDKTVTELFPHEDLREDDILLMGVEI